jgi:hypothetical protein
MNYLLYIYCIHIYIFILFIYLYVMDLKSEAGKIQNFVLVRKKQTNFLIFVRLTNNYTVLILIRPTLLPAWKQRAFSNTKHTSAEQAVSRTPCMCSSSLRYTPSPEAGLSACSECRCVPRKWSSSVLAWFRSEITSNYQHMVLVLVADPLCQNLKSASNVKCSY